MSELKWFVWNPYEQYHHFFETEQEAVEKFEQLIEMSNRYSVQDGEWPEEADEIFMGKITQRVELKEEDEDGYYYYKVVDV